MQYQYLMSGRRIDAELTDWTPAALIKLALYKLAAPLVNPPPYTHTNTGKYTEEAFAPRGVKTLRYRQSSE